jgi:short-subunit dehydrogenase
VTGASSGIGLAIAADLARRGCDLVLAARRPELTALAASLASTHGVRALAVTADLGLAGDAGRLWQRATEGGNVDILINSAGFGHYRRFGEVDWDRDRELLQLNILSLVELCHAFVRHQRGRSDARTGYVLNIASTAAFQPVPFFASYAASKAYVRSFTEALHMELRGTRMSATCLCPGGTHTEFHAIAGAGNYGRLANASMLSAQVVARRGVDAMLARRRTVVTGLLNRLSCFVVEKIPRGLALHAATWVLGKPRPGALPERTAPPLPPGET